MPPEAASAGEGAHFRALESLYRAAAINTLFQSDIEIAEPGLARIRFEVQARNEYFDLAPLRQLYRKQPA